MKPFIDECGIIHIAYMATAMFLSKEVVTTSEGDHHSTHSQLHHTTGGRYTPSSFLQNVYGL